MYLSIRRGTFNYIPFIGHTIHFKVDYSCASEYSRINQSTVEFLDMSTTSDRTKTSSDPHGAETVLNRRNNSSMNIVRGTADNEENGSESVPR